MIEYLSNCITDKLYECGTISENDMCIYRYGAEILLSSIWGMLSVLLIGFVLRKEVAAVVFLAVFIPVRTYTGGYHASSYKRCTLCTICMFLLTVILKQTIYAHAGMPAVIVSSACSIFVIARYSPIENEKKKLSCQQKKKNKFIAVVLSLVAILFSVVAVMLGSDIGYYLSASLLMVGMLMIVCVKGW